VNLRVYTSVLAVLCGEYENSRRCKLEMPIDRDVIPESCKRPNWLTLTPKGCVNPGAVAIFGVDDYQIATRVDTVLTGSRLHPIPPIVCCAACLALDAGGGIRVPGYVRKEKMIRIKCWAPVYE